MYRARVLDLPLGEIVRFILTTNPGGRAGERSLSPRSSEDAIMLERRAGGWGGFTAEYSTRGWYSIRWALQETRPTVPQISRVAAVASSR